MIIGPESICVFDQFFVEFVSQDLVNSTEVSNCSLMEPRVGNKFRLGRKIGSGSFGEIYLGLYIRVDVDYGYDLLFCFVLFKHCLLI